MRFSIKGFFIECFLRICSHLLKKSVMENLIFCAVFKPLGHGHCPCRPKLCKNIRIFFYTMCVDESYPLREKSSYSEFFWFIFSSIRTEYGEIPSFSPYSTQIQENVDHKNSEYEHNSHSDLCFLGRWVTTKRIISKNTGQEVYS